MSQVEQRITRQGPGCLLQLLWFIFVGSWASQAWLLLAWLLNLTIIGLPIGIWMLNRIPQIALLREPAQLTTVVRTPDGRIILRQTDLPQHPFILRALFFLLIGWWFSLVWSLLGWLLCVTIIGLPLGVLMLNRLPEVTTLMRH